GARYLDAQKLIGPVVVVALLLISATFLRARIFKSDQTLWEATQAQSKSWLVYNNYAEWIRDDSPIKEPNRRLEESELRFRRANEPDPRRVEPLYNLAVIADMRGRMAEAELEASTQPATQAATAPVALATTRPADYYQQSVQYLTDALAVDPNYM